MSVIAFMNSQVPKTSTVPLTLTEITRISATAYKVKGSGSGIIYLRNIDTQEVSQVQHDFNTGDYTLNHNEGERFEVSADGIDWMFDNKIRYIEYLQKARDYDDPLVVVLTEIEVIQSDINIALNKRVYEVGSAEFPANYPIYRITNGNYQDITVWHTKFLPDTARGGVRIDLQNQQNVDIVKVFSITILHDLLNVDVIAEKQNGVRSTIFKADRVSNNAPNSIDIEVKL